MNKFPTIFSLLPSSAAAACALLLLQETCDASTSRRRYRPTAAPPPTSLAAAIAAAATTASAAAADRRRPPIAGDRRSPGRSELELELEGTWSTAEYKWLGVRVSLDGPRGLVSKSNCTPP